MPEEYSSLFEPDRAPAKRSAARNVVPVAAAPQPRPQPVEPAAPPKPVEQPKPKAEVKKPTTVPETVFNLFDNSADEPKKSADENILMSPLKPVGESKPAGGDGDAISRLNDIMKQMEVKSSEEMKQKEDESKRMTESAYVPSAYGVPAAAPMMNPQMMQYMTNMAAFNSMGYYGANPYMTNYMAAANRPMYPAGNGPMPFQVLY